MIENIFSDDNADKLYLDLFSVFLSLSSQIYLTKINNYDLNR